MGLGEVGGAADGAPGVCPRDRVLSSEHQRTRIMVEFTDVRMNQCTDVRMYGYTDVRMYGCTDVRMYGSPREPEGVLVWSLETLEPLR